MKTSSLYILTGMLLVVACKKQPPKAVAHTAAVVFVTGGDVKLLTTSGESKVAKGTVLHENDKIQTGTKSQVDILLPGNIIVRLDQKSTLEMSEMKLGEGGVQADRLILQKGTVFAKVAKLEGKSSFAIKTPTLVAGVRGTKFMTEADEAGNGKVAVIEGKVGVESKTGQSGEVTEGEQASVTAAGGLTEAKMDAATAARTNELSAGVDKLKADQLQIFQNLLNEQKAALEKASGTDDVQERMKKSEEAIQKLKDQTSEQIKQMKEQTDAKVKEAQQKVDDQGAKSQDAIEKAKGNSVEEMRKKQQDLFKKQE